MGRRAWDLRLQPLTKPPHCLIPDKRRPLAADAKSLRGLCRAQPIQAQVHHTALNLSWEFQRSQLQMLSLILCRRGDDFDPFHRADCSRHYRAAAHTPVDESRQIAKEAPLGFVDLGNIEFA